MNMIKGFAGYTLIVVLAVMAYGMWQDSDNKARAQAQSERDARCSAEIHNPPPAFKRDLSCAGWYSEKYHTLTPQG